MAPRRSASTAGLDTGHRAKRNKSNILARGYSTQKVMHDADRVLLEFSTEVTQDKKFQASTHYITNVKYRLANKTGRFQRDEAEELATFDSYGIDKQHPNFQAEFLPNGHFKHLGIHGPRSSKDLLDAQKIMLLTHTKVGPHSHPKIEFPDNHRQLFKDSDTYHYLSEFELADPKHRSMGWGPILMRGWLSHLANADSGLGELSFQGLFLLSPAPIGCNGGLDVYMRTVHALIRAYKKSEYEVIVPGDDKANGPIYVMGRPHPKPAGLPRSTMFGVGAFDLDMPDSPLTPLPVGDLTVPAGLPDVRPTGKPIVPEDLRNEDTSSDDDEPLIHKHRKTGGLKLPASTTTQDLTMQDSSEDEDPVIPRQRNITRPTASTADRVILKPVPRRPRPSANMSQGTFNDKNITNITQATQSLTLSAPSKRMNTPLKRGAKPPRQGLDYPWHDRQVYLITSDTPQEWVTQGWKWYQNAIAEMELQASAAASAPPQRPQVVPAAAPRAQRPTPDRRSTYQKPPIFSQQNPRRSHYEVVDKDGQWPARRILDETKKSYLIEWESHPKTGEEFEPSWQPKWNANGALVREWMVRTGR
ncbi:hypothetical protein CLAFUW4_10622 [Fulvia fulva]|uniref:Chromo domain-containing protein n=1 Tax=Passalora fulva TaxID=5499 RepID=A0A9Q8LGR7_PASFU|nr:uncharacterized protein CLAFUR5_05235 [Fulvia fulva]KAK4616068.1 hypothetical protein CLAFUR4_10627 [Fulvia fulva]KAK4616833.1 hypothetical protein CLAFUR0_10617 [Fulvia fulva]UJO17095.1 hypothetical protein CLAFUR5_05235 [Fulvia fulva]WPV19419.1 hypothetical protein CLAFUW4_10622 [Fulvia fulva]WPV33997.1 hypothetical protein CLAFUW7_10624 [Fulvia fulva]